MIAGEHPAILALALAWLTGALYASLTVRRRHRAAPVLEGADVRPTVMVSVIVPARDEERSIGACVASLMEQDHRRLEVIVVDDGSTDRTAAVARSLGARVVEAGPLPAGWVGKPHACAVGARVATGEWLVFVDADTVAEPGFIEAAVWRAIDAKLDVLSPHPFQEVVTFWERTVIPAGFLLLALTRDVRQINNPQRRAGAVNGQCVVVRSEAYRAIGGHASVGGEILEDIAFGRRAKRLGLRIELADGSAFIRTRMYRSGPEVWQGLTKNAALAAGGPSLALAAGAGLLGLAAAPIAVPAVAMASGAAVAAAASIAGTAIFGELALRGPGFFGLRRRWALALPLGLAATGVITVVSAFKTWAGTRVWKGRRY